MPEPIPYRITRPQWTLAGLVLALGIARTAYLLLVGHHLEQTAMLFIGLPTLLALLVALIPARSPVGAMLRAMTIALVLSGLILGEGIICILMAAPFFYAIAFVVAKLVDSIRKRRQRRGPTLSVMLLPLLLSSFEGTTPALSFARDETVTVARRVAATPDEVERALASTPSFTTPLPRYLRMAFPRPVESAGSGLEPGALRRIHFAGGEGKPGDLLMRVAAREPRHVVFDAVRDGSKIAHWLDWPQADITWQAAGPNVTEVRWTIRYARRLDPAWYFGPWERYAVGLAGGYLIDNLATPRR